jgi:predicted DNA-binding transcriptional regulator AlpA
MITASLTASAIPRALYPIKEAEVILSTSHAQIYRLISAGRLDARKIGSRSFITAESIEAFLASLPKIGPERPR